MKTLLLSLIVLALCLYQNSIAQTSPTTKATTEASTTSWWTRTLPIVVTRTRPQRPIPPRRTTTPLVRVSDAVTIAVPVVLFVVTIIGGFGALYAVMVYSRRSRLLRQNDAILPY